MPEILRHKRLSAFGLSWTHYGVLRQLRQEGIRSQTPFGFWSVLDVIILTRVTPEDLDLSQTPFGFWYVLDTESMVKSISEAAWSQTPFGFWYVLDDKGQYAHDASGCQWSQTPFGFWYVLDYINVCGFQVNLIESQTPFGFWYVLD